MNLANAQLRDGNYRLLYVSAHTTWDEEHFGSDARQRLDMLVGHSHIEVESVFGNAFETAARFRDRVQKRYPADWFRSVDGVVIVGDYEAVPSTPMQIISNVERDTWQQWAKGEGKPLEEWTWPPLGSRDPDRWCVWNDDYYGDLDGDGWAEVPVSRIPIWPAYGFPAGEVHPTVEVKPVLGIRSADMPFAESVFATHLASISTQVCGKVPPDAAHRVSAAPAGRDYEPDDMAIQWGYVALHADSSALDRLSGNEIQFKPQLGSDGPDTRPDVARIVDIDGIDCTVAAPGSPFGGSVFMGVCWGALLANQAGSLNQDSILELQSLDESAALMLLNRGARAVVGFTARHHVPQGNTAPTAFGALLHDYFWHNALVCEMPPSRALFVAKAQYVERIETINPDQLAIAIAMKTYWSATCLGLGW